MKTVSPLRCRLLALALLAVASVAFAQEKPAEASPEQFVLRLRRAPERRIDIVAFAAPDAGSVDALATELASVGVRFASEPGTLSIHLRNGTLGITWSVR